jgi:hypothetical protein
MNIVKVIREFVASLDLSGRVLSLSNDGTNTTLVLENSYHLRERMQLNIDGADYSVVSVDTETNTAIIDGVLVSASTYTVPNPFFFHGTNYLIGLEFDIKEDADKLPMFYMESLTREVWGDDDSQYITTPDFRFVLADWANYADWLADEFVDKRLAGLRKLAGAIREHALDYTKFGSIDRFDIEQYYKLGRIKDKSGAVDGLFNHTLSGVSMRVTIPIFKCCNC